MPNIPSSTNKTILSWYGIQFEFPSRSIDILNHDGNLFEHLIWEMYFTLLPSILSCCELNNIRLEERENHLLSEFEAIKVFRYSFSEAIPIFFNRFKSVCFLDVRELKNHDEVHDDDVYWLGNDWNENVSFGGKKVAWDHALSLLITPDLRLGKRKLKMQSVGRSTTTLNVNTNVKLLCPFATNFSALASFKTTQDLIF